MLQTAYRIKQAANPESALPVFITGTRPALNTESKLARSAFIDNLLNGGGAVVDDNNPYFAGVNTSGFMSWLSANKLLVAGLGVTAIAAYFFLFSSGGGLASTETISRKVFGK